MKQPFLIFIAVLCSLNGYLLGRITTRYWSILDMPMTVEQNDHLERVPVVQIAEIENGDLVGSITGDVRVFLAGDLILPDGSGAFRIAADPFLVNHVSVAVPAGMRFVASARGKNYYPVDSARGSQLSPKNRIYFGSEIDAQKAGFAAGK